MTFLEIQNAVKGTRFKESQRADIKNWINHRYWWLWTLEQWTFLEGEALVSVTSGSRNLGNVPTDIRTVVALLNSSGNPLTYMPYDQFYRQYYGTNAGSGQPEAWTRVGNTFYVGPTSGVTASDYKLLYQKEFTALANDSDVPALPAGSHLALVHGGAAEGRKLESDWTYQDFEQDFAGSVDILRAAYLVDQRGPQQWPAYTPFGGSEPW